LPKLIRIGIDTGGTFTDFVISDGRRITSFKVPSTPHNPAAAIVNGLARISALALAERLEIVHGTTVATNTLLERKGARAALVTTAGFEDVLEIGRQARPDLYNLMVTRPDPLVARSLRLGVKERVAPDGQILIDLDRGEIADLIEKLASRQVESLAICLLFSFVNPQHEKMLEGALKCLGVPISISHKILPEYREYERTSTVVINAYLAPRMGRYLTDLERSVMAVGVSRGPENPPTSSAGKQQVRPPQAASLSSPVCELRIMQSSGGSVAASAAAREPVRTILSGPAGGVVGALKLAQMAGYGRIITFDMGGTSTDVSLCVGEARATSEATVAGLPVAVPVIDIHTVGAGGGSIARVDAGGALRVGPQSAGADPGPACYGKGEDVTVTDANLILGRFGAFGLLGGEITLDEKRAAHFMSRLASEMSRASRSRVTPIQAALGVVQVANANMEAALRVVSIERGYDPRFFTLVSFGGAGGLHVCALARALKIPRVLIPRDPGTLSALGVLLADVVKDYSQTVMMPVANLNRRKVERIFAELERRGRRELKEEGFPDNRITVVRQAAMRYRGQSFEIDVPWRRNFEAAFHHAHRQRYGYADAGRATEIVSLRVRCTGKVSKPRTQKFSPQSERKAEPFSLIDIHFGERATPTPVFKREELAVGARIDGPALITEYSSTTLLPSKTRLTVDQWLNLILEID